MRQRRRPAQARSHWRRRNFVVRAPVACATNVAAARSSEACGCCTARSPKITTEPLASALHCERLRRVVRRASRYRAGETVRVRQMAVVVRGLGEIEQRIDHRRRRDDALAGQASKLKSKSSGLIAYTFAPRLHALRMRWPSSGSSWRGLQPTSRIAPRLLDLARAASRTVAPAAPSAKSSCAQAMIDVLAAERRARACASRQPSSFDVAGCDQRAELAAPACSFRPLGDERDRLVPARPRRSRRPCGSSACVARSAAYRPSCE